MHEKRNRHLCGEKKQDCVLLMIQLQDVHAFRRVIRKHECKASFTKRKGLPFLLLKSKLNLGFTAGFVIFFVILFLLSNMIWEIDIKGSKARDRASDGKAS